MNMGIISILANCVSVFLSSPFYILILSVAITLAVSTLAFLKMKKLGTSGVMTLGYAHLTVLFFPSIFFALTMGCTQFGTCNAISTAGDSVIMVLPIAALTYYLFMPYFYKKAYNAREIRSGAVYKNMERLSKSLGSKLPRLFLIEGSTPNAFSVSGRSASIFLSVGVFELMDRKEVDSVLIHELGHIKSASAALKPLAWFTGEVRLLYLHSILLNALYNDELAADCLSSRVQGTARHLNAAKLKAHSFSNS